MHRLYVRRKLLRIVAGIFSIAFIAGCGSGGEDASFTAPATDTASQTINLSGTWAGTIVTPAIGRRSISMTLQQSGNVITGTVLIPGIAANVEGTVQNNVPQLRLTGSASGCVGTYGGTPSINGTTMTIPLTGFLEAPCNLQDGGTATLTK